MGRSSREPLERAEATDGSPVESASEAVCRSVEYGNDGRTVCYAEYGAEGGRPVVVLHGMPGSRLLGALFDGAARDRGTRLLAPDRPGFGRSSPWSGRRPADAEAWFEPLVAATSDSTVRVVAFSGGAADALALAGTRPDLVERVDLLSGAPPPALARETPRLTAALGNWPPEPPGFWPDSSADRRGSPTGARRRPSSRSTPTTRRRSPTASPNWAAGTSSRVAPAPGTVP